MLLNTLRMSAFLAAALMMTGFSTDARAGSLTGNATTTIGVGSGSTGADIGIGGGASVQTGQDYSTSSRAGMESGVEARSDSRFHNSDGYQEDRDARLESRFESSARASGAMTTGGVFNE